LTLEEIQTEYAKDSIIRYDDPNGMLEDSASGQMIHRKYLNYLHAHKNIYRSLLRKKETVQFWLEGYYLQGIYLEELKRTAKSPLIAKTKDQAEKMAKADPMYQSLMDRLEKEEDIVLYCKEVIDYIRWNRTKDIANWIEMKKYYSGM
jgi:hypothetical protein